MTSRCAAGVQPGSPRKPRPPITYQGIWTIRIGLNAKQGNDPEHLAEAGHQEKSPVSHHADQFRGDFRLIGDPVRGHLKPAVIRQV